jgi:hypothetical protein
LSLTPKVVKEFLKDSNAYSSEPDQADSNFGIVRLKDLARPENFAVLPRLDLSGARFSWQVGHTLTYFGSYADRPAYFERVRRNAVLSEPSFDEFRYLVIELTQEQFERASELNEQGKQAKNTFYDNLRQNEMRYPQSGYEFRFQMHHVGKQTGRQFRENTVLGWIDGRPQLPDNRDMW